jgi:hypothetical protein
MALDPKTAREEREAEKAKSEVPPELNPPFPYTRLSFDVSILSSNPEQPEAMESARL